MTYRDVLFQILCETTGQPKNEVVDLFDTLEDRFPNKGKLDDELTDEKAQELINGLRKEKSGILAWLAKGYMDVHKHTGHA